MRPPCEIVVWYVIPTIRSELAKELLNLGMKQKEISELLDITQPAVSQYISDKRGHGIKFNKETQKLIKESVSQKIYFILAALIIFLLEVIIRRLREIKEMKEQEKRIREVSEA